MEPQAPPPQSTGLSKTQITILVVAILTLMTALLVSDTRERRQARPVAIEKPSLTSEHRTAIDDQLRASRLPSPQSLELTEDGFLVATYEVRGRATEGSIRSFAEKTLLAIREAMLPYNFVKAYRVTVNGPPPGTGLIRRYGSARFIEGGSFEWESGIE